MLKYLIMINLKDIARTIVSLMVSVFAFCMQTLILLVLIVIFPALILLVLIAYALICISSFIWNCK